MTDAAGAGSDRRRSVSDDARTERTSEGGDPGRLAEENLPMARAVARRFLGRGAELDELCQAGAVGLVRAAESYDPSRNVPFASYAFRFIEGEIRSFLRSRSPIKLDRAAREKAARARRIAEQIENASGRECRMNELAAELGTDAVELCALFNASMGCVSIDDEDGHGAAYALSDASAGAEVERALDGAFLNSLMGGLSEKERSVIRLRYICDMTQARTAERLGLGQAQVSRYERSALVKMRSRAGAAEAGKEGRAK